MTNGTEPTWEQAMWDFLCALYRALGGDCADLAPRPTLPDPIYEVKALFETDGEPSFPTEQDELKFLALLDDIDAHLALPGNSLSSTASDDLTTLVAAIRAGV